LFLVLPAVATSTAYKYSPELVMNAQLQGEPAGE
jgi:hypothetical protein